MLGRLFEALVSVKTAAAHRLLEWSHQSGGGTRRAAAPALATIPVVDARYRRGVTTGGQSAAGYRYGARVARPPERWERW